MNYAVRTNNIQLVKRIFKWDKECRRMKDPKKTILDDTVANKWDFFRALKLGHTEIASEILLSTGINMPIEGEPNYNFTRENTSDLLHFPLTSPSH